MSRDDDPATDPAGFVPQTAEPAEPRRRLGKPEPPWPEGRLTPGEVEQELTGMPGWSLGLAGRWIVRTFDFADFAQALAFAGFAGTFAAAGRYYPLIEIQRNRVRLKLGARLHGELTGVVLEMAKQLELTALALGAGEVG